MALEAVMARGGRSGGPMLTAQRAGALLAALVASTPGAVRSQFAVLALFITIDTITGVWIAARCGQMRSRTMCERLVSKSMQYACIVALGLGGQMISGQWVMVIGAISACIYIEVMSIMENLIRLESCGGAPLGPARPFLQRAQKYFAVAAEVEPAAPLVAPIVNAIAVSQKEGDG